MQEGEEQQESVPPKSSEARDELPGSRDRAGEPGEWERELAAARSLTAQPDQKPPKKPGEQKTGEQKTARPKVTSSLVRALRKIPLFTGLSPSLIQKILSMCALRACAAEEVLCVGGDNPSDEMYILLSGKLAVMTADGLRIATLTPVMTVGEMGFITRKSRSATVVAINPSHVLTIAKAQFDFMVRGDRDMQATIYRNIIDILSTKIINDNMRTRDYLVEKVGFESRLQAQDQRIEIALDLLAERGSIPRAEALAYIDEKLADSSPRILIVDDEPAFRQILREIFPTCVVLEAGNGREALEIAREEPPDLVISDIRMPQMDGYALLNHLRQQYPDLPVLAISGYVDSSEVQDYAFDAFVEKPVRLGEFKELVEQLLTSRDSAPQSSGVQA